MIGWSGIWEPLVLYIISHIQYSLCATLDERLLVNDPQWTTLYEWPSMNDPLWTTHNKWPTMNDPQWTTHRERPCVALILRNSSPDWSRCWHSVSTPNLHRRFDSNWLDTYQQVRFSHVWTKKLWLNCRLDASYFFVKYIHSRQFHHPLSIV